AQMWAKDNGWEQVENEKVVVELIAHFPAGNKKRDASNALKLMLDSFEGIIYKDDTFALPRIMDFDHVAEGEEPYFELYIYKKEDELDIAYERVKAAREAKAA